MQRKIYNLYIHELCIVVLWIVGSCIIVQPTEPDLLERLGNLQTNRKPFIFFPSVPVPSVMNFIQNNDQKVIKSLSNQK